MCVSARQHLAAATTAVVMCGVALSCTNSDSSSACATSSEAPKCLTLPSQCDQAARESSSAPFIYSLRLQEQRQDASLDADTVRGNWNCLIDVLEREDVDVLDSDNDDMARVLVRASFERLEPALSLAAVVSFDIECDESQCAHCWDLEEDACTNDAFCYPLNAQRFNSELGCREDKRFVGCSPEGGCDDSETLAGPPNGDCYWFRDGCIPRDWVECDPSQGSAADAGDPFIDRQCN